MVTTWVISFSQPLPLSLEQPSPLSNLRLPSQLPLDSRRLCWGIRWRLRPTGSQPHRLLLYPDSGGFSQQLKKGWIYFRRWAASCSLLTSILILPLIANFLHSQDAWPPKGDYRLREFDHSVVLGLTGLSSCRPRTACVHRLQYSLVLYMRIGCYDYSSANIFLHRPPSLPTRGRYPVV